MLPTYKATLKGDRLEWSGEPPKHLSGERPVKVYITILEEPAISSLEASNGEQMAAALEQLAAVGGVADIAEPLEWERETRRERG